MNHERDEVDAQKVVAAGQGHQKIVPNWSVALAIFLFCRSSYLFHGVLPYGKHSSLPMRLLMGYSWGTVFGSDVLLVGYVSLDVKRRGMAAGCGC